jgi:ATP-binding cassette, subfamily B, bacterial
VLLASSVGFTLLNMKFSESIKRISERIQAAAGKITESTGNILAGQAVIRQFRLRDLMLGRFEGHNRGNLSLSKERAFKSAWLEAYNSVIGWINFGGILAIGAFLAGKKLMTFGTMVALVNYLWSVNRMIRETGRGIAGFQGYLAGEARVAELGRVEPEPAEPDPERFSREADGEIAIRMRDIRFSYDGKRDALSGLDLVARRGQTIALVGPSGGGKSTVVKLLLGFYRPTGGELSLGGLSSERPSLARLRELMAYVPQDPFMFDGTVAENIRYGKSGASEEEVEAAARAACAHDFILGLEKGYGTLVGERGVKLSGGQRQRIAIARAFIKDAPILLMDEATSSLDSQSEGRIQDALRGLGGKKTVVLIAHRLSTIETADMIYVIDRGRAVEEGRHAELLARGGLYKKLHEMQFRLGDGEAAEA